MWAKVNEIPGLKAIDQVQQLFFGHACFNKSGSICNEPHPIGRLGLLPLFGLLS